MLSKKTGDKQPIVSVYDVYKKIKRSGNFRRKLKNRTNQIVCGINVGKSVIVQCQQQSFQQNVEDDDSLITSNTWLDIDISDDESANNQPLEQISKVPVTDMQMAFKSGLSKWAIQHNVPHTHLRSLISMCNETLQFQLPSDPRSIFQTPRSTMVRKCGSGDGLYWHRGLRDCLHSKLQNRTGLPKKISLNVNIDGLPISKSSNAQFWPILFNIHELHSIEPGIVGIFCGTGKNIFTRNFYILFTNKKVTNFDTYLHIIYFIAAKPSSLTDYLNEFVEEMNALYDEGIVIDGQKIAVTIRAFVCDTPARAYLKGNFHDKCEQNCFDGIILTNRFILSICSRYDEPQRETWLLKVYRHW